MKIHVIQNPTSKIQKEFTDWKKYMESQHYGLKIHSITPSSYEDRESNYSVSSLIIVFETYGLED